MFVHVLILFQSTIRRPFIHIIIWNPVRVLYGQQEKEIVFIDCNLLFLIMSHKILICFHFVMSSFINNDFHCVCTKYNYKCIPHSVQFRFVRVCSSLSPYSMLCSMLAGCFWLYEFSEWRTCSLCFMLNNWAWYVLCSHKCWRNERSYSLCRFLSWFLLPPYVHANLSFNSSVKPIWKKS